MAYDGKWKIILSDSDFDDELEMLAVATMAMEKLNTENSSAIRRGSIQGHSVIFRNRVEGHERLYRDYFAKSPTYPPNLFRRRFRMNRSLFVRILSNMEVYDPYFVQKNDAVGNIGLSPLQKMTAAIRMLAYGVAADVVDDYVRIGESTAIESLQRFVSAIVAIYSDEHLRSPNSADIARLLAIGERRGFPGMLGSIDCMHWRWKNCPTAWKGMYSSHVHEPTIILEAVASYDLWIWHAFFGLPGSHNDINVLERYMVLLFFRKVELLWLITPSMETIILWDIILLMVYIQSGPRLSKQFHVQEAISKYILHELKSQPKRMLRELLECFKHDLL